MYYYWAITVWKNTDLAIFDLINNGTLEETTDSYITKKSFTWKHHFIHIDKTLIMDDKLDITISDCHFVIKDKNALIFNFVTNIGLTVR